QIGVRVEQVIGDVLEDRLDLAAGELAERRMRVGDGGLVHQVLERDRIARKQRRAPAETGRERDLRALYGEQRVEQQLIEAAVEVAAPVEQALGDRQLFLQLALIGSARLGDIALHFCIGGQKVGKHGQKAIAEIGHSL